MIRSFPPKNNFCPHQWWVTTVGGARCGWLRVYQFMCDKCGKMLNTKPQPILPCAIKACCRWLRRVYQFMCDKCGKMPNNQPQPLLPCVIKSMMRTAYEGMSIHVWQMWEDAKDPATTYITTCDKIMMWTAYDGISIHVWQMWETICPTIGRANTRLFHKSVCLSVCLLSSDVTISQFRELRPQV